MVVGIRRLRVSLLVGLFLLLLGPLAVHTVGSVSAQSPPTAPVVYWGTVMVDGTAAPDGLKIVGKILDYESPAKFTANGKYDLLPVAPPSGSYLYREVKFYIIGEGYELEAGEIDPVYYQGPRLQELDLTFPALPLPTPTPTAIATPIPTAIPTVIATPVPTPMPIPTPQIIYVYPPTPEPTPIPTPEPTLTPAPVPSPQIIVVVATPTMTPIPTTETEDEARGGVCSRGSGSGDLSMLLGAGLGMGMLFKKKFQSM